MPVRPLPALVAVGIAGLALQLFVVPTGRAFTSQGYSLPLDQRDVRVLNNFTDAESNDNVTPHANWPGAVGAPLAVWKAVAEWGSRLHGDGQGDPSQPGDVGSGGANFDVTWQGLAPDIGTLSGNVVSAMLNCGGGILAISEFGPFGWRIRLCDDWLWDDGPGTQLSANALDIQGAIAHEYGHALGLGHSNVAGSTMFPTASGNGVAARSIAADDSAGVQFIYGVASPAKPRIDSALPAAQLLISGADFAPSGNEVWFTRASPNADGTPLVVAGLVASLGGTQIALALPVGAGAGDVLVRVPGANGNALSNAYPLDPAGCPPPAVYCTAKPSSNGCTALIAALGTPSASASSGFVVHADEAPNQTFGLLFYGQAGAAAVSFQGGTLCVAGALTRTPGQNSGGDALPASNCSGAFQIDFNAWISAGSDPTLVAGSPVFCQYWYRDPGFAPPNTSALSAGLAFLVCP